MAWWGLSLLAPGDTFSLSQAYAGMARVLPEWAWGLICIFVGGFRLAALTINGTFHGSWYSRYSPHVRAVTAYLTALIYVLIVYSILTNAPLFPLSTALGAYSALAFLDILNALGTAKESGYQTREYRNDGVS